MTKTYTHATRVAPRCHDGPGLGPVVSRHTRYELAVRAVRRDHRLVVVEVNSDGEAGDRVIYQVRWGRNRKPRPYRLPEQGPSTPR